MQTPEKKEVAVVEEQPTSEETSVVETAEVEEVIESPTSHIIPISPISPISPPQPILNLKTNALYNIALTPNLTLEFLPKNGHITLAAEWMWANWRNDNRNKTWVLQNILLEGRYYLKGNAAYTGHHFDIYANAGKYDVQFDGTHGYQSLDFGKTWGAGIGWGYVKRIGTSNWKWEVNAAIGYLQSPYDSYHAAESWAQPDKWYYDYHGDPTLFRALGKKLNYFGLTRLGFSISYDIPWFGWKKPIDKQ